MDMTCASVFVGVRVCASMCVCDVHLRALCVRVRACAVLFAAPEGLQAACEAQLQQEQPEGEGLTSSVNHCR